MKWINAEQQVTVTIYDEEHEEHFVKTMTVEEMLDTYTNEGCPTMYSNPEQKGKWIPVDSFSAFGGDEAMWMAYGNPVAFYYCSECKEQAYAGEDGESLLTDFCPFCGADMRCDEMIYPQVDGITSSII